jgi:hypothetical protein
MFSILALIILEIFFIMFFIKRIMFFEDFDDSNLFCKCLIFIFMKCFCVAIGLIISGFIILTITILNEILSIKLFLSTLGFIIFNIIVILIIKLIQKKVLENEKRRRNL